MKLKPMPCDRKCVAIATFLKESCLSQNFEGFVRYKVTAFSHKTISLNLDFGEAVQYMSRIHLFGGPRL